eukprot:3505917-Rhodomonas_salina.2
MTTGSRAWLVNRRIAAHLDACVNAAARVLLRVQTRSLDAYARTDEGICLCWCQVCGSCKDAENTILCDG